MAAGVHHNPLLTARDSMRSAWSPHHRHRPFAGRMLESELDGQSRGITGWTVSAWRELSLSGVIVECMFEVLVYVYENYW
jgi:hypothetical protein